MMQVKILSAIVILLMLSSSVPVLAEGPWINVNGHQNGDVLTLRTIELNGTAAPTPDAWVQDSTLEWNAGSLDNVTITKEGNLATNPFLGVFTKDDNNPLLEYGDIGAVDEFGASFGAVIRDGSTYKMWGMAQDNSNVYNLQYYESSDGISWDAQNGSLDLGGNLAFDQMRILPGTVIKDGAIYKMWYTGVDSEMILRIGYATSTDGITWTKGHNGEPVLDLGPVNKFDGGGTANPAVIKENGKFKMWYAGMISYSDNLFQIGYATSLDGITWSRENKNEPVLSFGKANAFDKDGVYGTTIFKDGDVYRMFYLGIPTRSVGYATSTDGFNWKRANDEAAVLEPTGGTFDEVGITGIGIIRVGNDYNLYYSGLDSSQHERIGLATAKLDGLVGIFESNIFVGDFKVDWTNINISADLPEGTTVSIITRSSNDRVDWSTWKAPVNEMNAWKNAKFMQYRLSMGTPDGLSIPTITAVRLGFEAIERVEVSTDNSTWLMATGTNSWNITLFLKEGPNKVFVRILDTTLTPIFQIMDLTVDTIKPTGIVKINSDGIYTTETAVHLTLAANDARGVFKLRLGTVQSNLPNETWMNYTGSLDYEMRTNDGIITIYCQVMDGTGLISNMFSDSVILDTTPPNGTVLINNGAPIATFQAVQIALTAQDINGVSEMRVSNTNNLTGSEWKPYARLMDWELEAGDGIKTVYVEFKDNAGNTKIFEDAINLDTNLPTGTLEINNGDTLTMNRDVIIDIDAKDANGIAYVMLSNDPDFLQGIWVKYNSTLPWTLPEKLGPQTVYAKLKDTAGLVSIVMSASIILDIHEEGFVGTIVINNNDEYTNNQTLNATLDLVGWDTATTVMLSDNPDFTGGAWVAFADKLIVQTTSTNGLITVYAKFKDRYGIISDVATDSIILDTTAPTVNILTPKANAKVTTDKITITGEASDNQQLRTVEVQLPNGAWMPVNDPKSISLDVYLPKNGKYTIQVRAVDEAGNIGTSSVTVNYNKGEGTSTKVPGFEASLLIFVVLVLAIVVSRRKMN